MIDFSYCQLWQQRKVPLEYTSAPAQLQTCARANDGLCIKQWRILAKAAMNPLSIKISVKRAAQEA